MENGCYDAIVVTEFVQIFLGLGLQGFDCGDILDNVTAHTVTDGNVFDALLCRKQRFDNSDCIGNRRRNERSG